MASFLKNRAALKRYAWLSITAAIVNITLKGGAYFLTGSVGLLSDGMEGWSTSLRQPWPWRC